MYLLQFKMLKHNNLNQFYTLSFFFNKTSNIKILHYKIDQYYEVFVIHHSFWCIHRGRDANNEGGKYSQINSDDLLLKLEVILIVRSVSFKTEQSPLVNAI